MWSDKGKGKDGGIELSMQFFLAKCKHADTFSSNIAMKLENSFHRMHTVTACR